MPDTSFPSARIAKQPYADILTERTSTYQPHRTSLDIPRQPTSHEIFLRKFEEFFGTTQPLLFREFKSMFSYKNQTEQQRDIMSIETKEREGRQPVLRSRKARHTIRVPMEGPSNLKIQSIKRPYQKDKLEKMQICSLECNLNPQTSEKIIPRAILRSAIRIQTKTAVKTRRSFNALVLQLNPSNRPSFTYSDLYAAILLLHGIEPKKLLVSRNYYNVYVDEGNNSQLMKNLIRRRSGWRLVELPSVANFIWTQNYRRQDKKFHKRVKQYEEEDQPNSTTRVIATVDSNFLKQISKLIPKEQEVITYPSPINCIPPPFDHNSLIHNHFPGHRCISDKRNLLINLTEYYATQHLNPFDYLPESYNVSSFEESIEAIIRSDESSIWIVKPGQSSNRGKGITVCHGAEETIHVIRCKLGLQKEEKITQNLPSLLESGQVKELGGLPGVETKVPLLRRLIVQRYIKPLLYNRRKFDIRSYLLVTFLNGHFRAYFYEQCYIRTCSKQFDIHSTNKYVHLTNDAIQANAGDYGKYEEGNKVSMGQFQKYIDELYKGKIWASLKREMQQRAIDIVKCAKDKLLVKSKREKIDLHSQDGLNFQLFGLDFMIDQVFKLWLIEVNTNPSITHDCSKVLVNLIPKLIDNVLAVAVEPLMRPIKHIDTTMSNGFVLIHSFKMAK